MATDLSGDIAQQAAEPVTVSADGQTTTARPVADVIAAQQYLDARAAVRKRRRGVLFTKLVAPGALDDGGRAAGAVAPFGGGIT